MENEETEMECKPSARKQMKEPEYLAAGEILSALEVRKAKRRR